MATPNTMYKTKKERTLLQNSTPEEKRNKSQKTDNPKGIDHKQVTKCNICNKVIIDQSASHSGEEAIYCEGVCCGWLHRHCVGLSVSQFAHMSTGTQSFYCVYCTLQQQALEIKELKKTVKTLISDMAKISSGDTAGLSARPVYNTTTTSKSPAANPLQHSNNTSHNEYKPKHPTSSDNESSIRHEDRKLNLVVFGIDESPSNTPRLDRLKNDLDHLAATFNSIEALIEVYTIKDFTAWETIVQPNPGLDQS